MTPAKRTGIRSTALALVAWSASALSTIAPASAEDPTGRTSTPRGGTIGSRPPAGAYAGPIGQALFQHDGQDFRVVSAGGVPTAATGMINQTGLFGGCLTGSCGRPSVGCATDPMYAVGGCGSGACGGSCGVADCGGTCGDPMCGGTCGNVCGGAGYTRKSWCGCEYGYYAGKPICDPCYDPCNVARGDACTPTPCYPYIYTGAEFLAFGRGGDGDVDFDWAPGFRFTFGRLKDCARGCEFVYTFLGDFQADEPQVVPVAFANALIFEGDYDATFNSIEINKVLVAQDILKIVVGGKYLNYNEDVSNGVFALENAPLATYRGLLGGDYELDVDNNLVGVHLGADVFYPLTTRLYTDLRGRAGGYVNFADVDGDASVARVVDISGTGVLDTGDLNIGASDEEIAGLFEVGLGVRYLASERLSLFTRFELGYLTGMATARNQVIEVTNSGNFANLEIDDDILLYGFTFGGELRF